MSDGTPVRYEAARLSPADRLLLQQDRPSATAHYDRCPACVPGYELQAVALHAVLQAITIALAHEHAVSLVPRDDGYELSARQKRHMCRFSVRRPPNPIEVVIHGRAGECECGQEPNPP